MRTSRIAIAGILLLSAGIPEATGQTLEEDVRASLREHSRPLAMEADALAGPGGSWLVEQAAAARFTLIGESHLTAETPAFTAALLTELAPSGYSTYVLESGPVATRLVVEALQSGGMEGAERLLTEHAFAIAFLDQREELRAVGRAMELDYDVWGIDQDHLSAVCATASDQHQREQQEEGRQSPHHRATSNPARAQATIPPFTLKASNPARRSRAVARADREPDRQIARRVRSSGMLCIRSSSDESVMWRAPGT